MRDILCTHYGEKRITMINKDFLNIFGLKPIPQKVLLDIVQHGNSKVAEISVRLNIPKSTIYDAIAILVQKSLVNEYSDDKGKSFGISDNEQLARVHADRIEELKNAHSSLLSFINNHTKEEGVAKPTIKFYSGTIGIKQAFRDMPWSNKYKETYLMWPMKDMMDSLDEAFLKWHGTQRFKYGVIINAIEKYNDRILQSNKHEWLKNDLESNLARIKYLPKGVDWKMSYWIYGDKCLFASGGKEKIAFTIHSKEFCDIMKLMWQQMWEVAKK